MLLNYNHVNQVVMAAKEAKPAAEPKPPKMAHFDVYTAEHKFTKERVLVKVLKDFKQKPEYFKQQILKALTKQIVLQQSSKGIVHALTYTMANNNLYISSEACLESLRHRC